MAAAWFHDVGYLFTTPKLHEAKGADVAALFLVQQDVPDPLITHVQDCILATRMPQAPHNLLEQILCDADLFHFGNIDFQHSTRLLHLEVEALNGQAISDYAWNQQTSQLLKCHQYFTSFAQEHQRKQKAKNHQALLEILSQTGVNG